MRGELWFNYINLTIVVKKFTINVNEITIKILTIRYNKAIQYEISA